MTVDEELNVLEEVVRRLKIEYDVFFGGGSKKPPSDTEWRVQNLIRKYSDSSKLSYAQRFKYNGIVQRYSLFSDLWRQKMKIKEEGYRRPQDAVLGISGDSPFSHAEFHKRNTLPFPLLSDVHRKVIQAYDVWDEERNVAYRSTAIVDHDGKLRWSQSGDRLMTRSGAEIRRVLELIQRLRAST